MRGHLGQDLHRPWKLMVRPIGGEQQHIVFHSQRNNAQPVRLRGRNAGGDVGRGLQGTIGREFVVLQGVSFGRIQVE
jgi:hypothetical protein